jgi:hypothetical protein
VVQKKRKSAYTSPLSPIYNDDCFIFLDEIWMTDFEQSLQETLDIIGTDGDAVFVMIVSDFINVLSSSGTGLASVLEEYKNKGVNVSTNQ